MLKILELFGGIGACTTALKRLGIDYEIADYVEIDKYACASYNAINGTSFEPQDIKEWNKDIYADLIMHGSPCQDFSIAGKQAGGDKDSGTRSSLMYETLRIIEKIKPKYVIWENVKNLLSKKHRHNFDNYLESMQELGYKNYYQVLNAKDYGIPQNRERVFTISIRNDIEKEFIFPTKQELKLRLKDMLEQQVDEKYYLSDKMCRYITSEDDKYKVNKDLLVVNRDIACSKTTREGQTRADTSDYVSEKLNYTNYSLQKIKNNFVKEDIVGTITANAMQSFNHNNCHLIKVKNANKQGYDIATIGDSVNLQQPNSETRRGRVGHEVNQTLQTTGTMGVVTIGNYTPSNHEASRVVDSEFVAPTVKENHGTVTATNTNDLRIRKLTPKECWRLMGFNDEEFEKAAKVNSNTQLYKQAGNSIVVNVLEKILENLEVDND